MMQPLVAPNMPFSENDGLAPNVEDQSQKKTFKYKLKRASNAPRFSKLTLREDSKAKAKQSKAKQSKAKQSKAKHSTT